MSCELLDFIMQSMLTEMREHAFSETQLTQVVQIITPIVTEKTISNFGGNKIYIPKRSEHQHDINLLCAEQFTGNNISEISHNMKVSRRTVYRAIQNYRLKQKKQR